MFRRMLKKNCQNAISATSEQESHAEYDTDDIDLFKKGKGQQMSRRSINRSCYSHARMSLGTTIAETFPQKSDSKFTCNNCDKLIETNKTLSSRNLQACHKEKHSHNYFVLRRLNKSECYRWDVDKTRRCSTRKASQAYLFFSWYQVLCPSLFSEHFNTADHTGAGPLCSLEGLTGCLDSHAHLLYPYIHHANRFGSDARFHDLIRQTHSVHLQRFFWSLSCTMLQNGL